MSSIILLGIKHCGKSSQAKLLSEALKLSSFDTDNVIAEMTGLSPREIYATQGEAAFKDAEVAACRHIVKVVSESGKDAVIATGGGICNNKEALDILRTIGTFVFLKTEEKIAADRIIREAVVKDDGTITNIPAYIAKKNPYTLDEVREFFHPFFVERVKVYSELADINIRMGEDTKQVNTQKILKALGL